MDRPTRDRQLQHALACLRQGQLDEAERTLERFGVEAPDDPDALQLLAAVRRRRGDVDGSERLFRRSLELAPRQPHVHNNLGNLLLERGQPADAAACYATAIGLYPAYVDAWCNLGIAELQRDDLDAAERAFARAIELAPRGCGGWIGAGDVAARRQRHRDAIERYARAVELAPERAPAWHKLGLACRETGDFERALSALNRARSLAGTVPEIHYSHANVSLDAGRVADAENSYRTAIELQPDYREAHDALNRLLRQYRAGERYLESYAAAVEQAPHARPLYVDWADKLLLSNRGADALGVLDRARARGLDAPDLRHRRAKALADQGRVDESIGEFRAAIAADPAARAPRIDFARVLLCVARVAEARAQLEALLATDPFDQVALAYLAPCLEATGDARLGTWFDHAQLVRGYTLAAPPGFATIGEFNHALARALTPLHDAVDAPTEQTLRGGTQTLGDLFARRVPEVELLQVSIAAAVDAYVAGLADLPESPLTRRRTARWRYSGSWSVRLRRGGHHTNHVHSEGWISSCYYVTVPEAVRGSETHQGWLKLGQSNLGRGIAERVARYVEPQDGLLVLFPSYFFHGTVPFESDQHRLTVAFDIVPA